MLCGQGRARVFGQEASERGFPSSTLCNLSRQYLNLRGLMHVPSSSERPMQVRVDSGWPAGNLAKDGLAKFDLDASAEF